MPIISQCTFPFNEPTSGEDAHRDETRLAISNNRPTLSLFTEGLNHRRKCNYFACNHTEKCHRCVIRGCKTCGGVRYIELYHSSGHGAFRGGLLKIKYSTPLSPTGMVRARRETERDASTRKTEARCVFSAALRVTERNMGKERRHRARSKVDMLTAVFDSPVSLRQHTHTHTHTHIRSGRHAGNTLTHTVHTHTSTRTHSTGVTARCKPNLD